MSLFFPVPLSRRLALELVHAKVSNFQISNCQTVHIKMDIFHSSQPYPAGYLRVPSFLFSLLSISMPIHVLYSVMFYVYMFDMFDEENLRSGVYKKKKSSKYKLLTHKAREVFKSISFGNK